MFAEKLPSSASSNSKEMLARFAPDDRAF